MYRGVDFDAVGDAWNKSGPPVSPFDLREQRAFHFQNLELTLLFALGVDTGFLSAQ